MNRCITPTGSTTSRWLAATNRLYSTSTSTTQSSSQDDDSARILSLLSRWKPAAILRPHTLRRAAPPPHATVTAEQSHHPPKAPHKPFPDDPQTATYNLLPAAPHGEPAAATAGENTSPPVIHQRPPLPTSPLMDPDVIAAKEKYVARKPRPSKNPELLQQILGKNPYARALATPLRRCALTCNALPSFFLQDFNLMAHPETGNPWYVPRSLAKYKGPTVSEKEIDADLEPKEEKVQTSQTQQISAESTAVLGYSVYTIASQHTIRAMQDPRGYGRKQTKRMKDLARRRGMIMPSDVPPARFIPDRYRQSRDAGTFLSTARWRSDMHEFVLNLMRRRILEDLVRVTNSKRGYVVGCSGWEDALAKPQVGAFLWTGGDGELDEGQNIPPEFATLDVPAGRKEESRTRKVPVHNLRRFLGKDKLAELREKLPSGIFEREVVVLRRKQYVVDLEMQLWKMQGYLAEYRELYRDLEEPQMQGLDGESEEDDDDEDDAEDEEDEGW
ncbi:hypothetical protein F5882DRAFT_408358 [Hyaloscypha sp. PMI_1271]|nr:hypothetical protein F5882DRAFT_408358 [Hyaloscypha sp. PMI_1271]